MEFRIEGNIKMENVSVDQTFEQQELLKCPIRGKLTVKVLAKDNLTLTEESRRIEFLQFLLSKKYPKDQIDVETTILKNLGESGRNKLRCDVIVYNIPKNEAKKKELKDRLDNVILVAEIKRDSNKKDSGVDNQLEPAMRQLPSLNLLGVYWDDVNRILYVKKLLKSKSSHNLNIIEDNITNLPDYGVDYQARVITLNSLTPINNFVGLLMEIANVMRSHGVNDEHTRYKETVKLILARYCDEKMAEDSESKNLQLQVLPGEDPGFKERIKKLYLKSAKRYSKAETLFKPLPDSELSERTLREIVKIVQSIKFLDASNETMQQVFQSFVPAVFKKSLDQFFTPQGLIEAMVNMVSIASTDKIIDPAMGTADFLTNAMEFRLNKGDKDIIQRIYGVDSDPKAFDLAIINMILNKDGQSNLYLEDSIENHSRWLGEMNVALCNPPFGEKSVEKRINILKNYDLGHKWNYEEKNKKWVKTKNLLSSQHLGILFIEKCWKLLSDDGRLAIILPEGYLCTPSYGYVREWILSSFKVLSLTELPRRVFTKSDADLRSNILILQKLDKETLKKAQEKDYPIHTDIVRKVGFKMGKGFQPLYQRDSKTGVELRKSDNSLFLDSDFSRVNSGFENFKKDKRCNFDNGEKFSLVNWTGAKFSDMASHPTLDMKPRRLMPLALQNIRDIKNKKFLNLGSICELEESTVDIIADYGHSKMLRLVEGIDIRAVEGVVVPQFPSRVWKIAERKSKKVYKLKLKDIVIGLVRPERRNVGILLVSGDDLVASTDGVGIIRVKKEFQDIYPQEFIFSILRSEIVRLQLWTESGGTSYGKLTRDHILNTLIPIPDKKTIQDIAKQVRDWSTHHEKAIQAWNAVGSEEDRRPIINSSAFGLVQLNEEDAEDDDE